MSAVRNVIIIGSGPAGWTAALYSARANLQPLLFEGDLPNLPGGQLMITTEVENYPGFPKGIAGPELMDAFRAQAARFGTEIVTENVTRVDFSGSRLVVETAGARHEARSVIIATGANAKWLGVPGEAEAMNRGASACATCDGALFKGRELAVIGGGDTAMEEGLFLTRFASSVSVIHRRDRLRASKVMAERAQKNSKLRFVWNREVVHYLFDEEKFVSGLRLRDVKSGVESDFHCGGVFVAIGHVPNTEIFRGVLEMDELGYLKTRLSPRAMTATAIPGVFVCGDAQDSYYRQAITAAGSGCSAAIDAERYLDALGH